MDRDDEETLMITQESLEKLGGYSTSSKPSPSKMPSVVVPTKVVSSLPSTQTTTTSSMKSTPRKMDAEG